MTDPKQVERLAEKLQRVFFSAMFNNCKEDNHELEASKSFDPVAKHVLALFAPLVEAGEGVMKYFTSGNSIPVERATILSKSEAITKLRDALASLDKKVER